MTKINYPTPDKKTKKKANPTAKSAIELKVKKSTRSKTNLVLHEDTVA
jgi:hypothetical protein